MIKWVPLKKRWAVNIEINVDYQVYIAKKLYEDLISLQQLVVIGGAYDFQNSYRKGRGTLVITNIDGRTSTKSIIDHPIMRKLTEKQLFKHVSRLSLLSFTLMNSQK